MRVFYSLSTVIILSFILQNTVEAIGRNNRPGIANSHIIHAPNRVLNDEAIIHYKALPNAIILDKPEVNTTKENTMEQLKSLLNSYEEKKSLLEQQRKK